MILVMVALDLAGPVVLARAIDAAVEQSTSSRLIGIAGLFIGVSVVAQLLSAITTYLGTRIGWTVANDLRLVAARHVTSLDLDYHTTTNPGTLIERVDGDITSVAQFFSNFAVRVVSTSLLLVGIITLTFLEHPTAGFATLGFTIVVTAVLMSTRSIAIAASAEQRGVAARLYGFIEERLSAIDDIRANGAGALVMMRFKEVMRDYFFKSRRADMRRSVIWVTAIGFFSAGSLLALVVGTRLVGTGAITVGTAYLIFQFMTKLEAPIEEITNQMQELQKAAAGLGRLTDILDIPPAVDRSGTTPLPRGALSVVFEDVTFAYEDTVVLDHIDMRLEPGDRLGLLGRTGGGKSTLTKLAARFYDPGSGCVRLAGVDLRDAEPDSVRSQISFITQDVQLFEGTVKQNITFFDDSVPDDRVVHALSEIGLGEWAATLEEGIHTPLGSGGAGMSSGEAQLVALARAYLRNPGLIILDEPSSRVDPATEVLITLAIDRLTAARTAIIIAHRLDTVRHVDKIAVMAEGRLMEFGDRQTLADDPESRFATLLEASADGLLPDGGRRT